MRQADRAEGQADNHHQIGQAGDAAMFRTERLELELEFLDGAGIGTAARIDRLCTRSQEDQHRHPHIADATSTTANWPKVVASTWKISFIASMLAPPPIQLPASVVMPAQVSPATVSGCTARNSRKASTAPTITLSEAAAYISTSFGPSLRIAFRSIDRVSSTSAAGSSTRLATGL